MAGTEFPVNHPLAVKHWSTDLMKEALKRTVALPFIGKDRNSIVQIKTETSKAAGDRIRFGIRQQLSGAGILGDGTLEGNEEALETFSQDVLIDQLRHAVRSAGKMSEQRVPWSMRAEARDALADWWADRFDAWFFNQLAGNTAETDVRYTGNQAVVAPDADHIAFPTGSSIAESSISNTTVQRMSLTQIDRAVEKAKLAKNTMRQVRDGPYDILVMFLHPFQVTDLRTNTAAGQWQDIQKAAMSGGNVTKNPIFTGALGMYNGVVLHESTRVPAAPGNPNVRRAVLLGAQAGVIAFGRGYGKGVYSWEEEMFDYGNQLGVAAGCIAGMTKTRFNGSDFASIVVPTWATPVS
jgi:N4-gp56 family major capsid protein